MDASSSSNRVAHPGLDANAPAGLYDIFRVGSAMFERPSTRRTFRLVEAAVREIAGCTVQSAYVVSHGRLTRYSGAEDHDLDLLVEACRGVNGVLAHGAGWIYALFFRGTGTVRGALAIRADHTPTGPEVDLLLALAEPTGAALAVADLISRERRQARELRRLGQAHEASNRALAATIVQLNAQQSIRDAIVTAAGSGRGEDRIVEAVSTVTGRPVVLQDSFGNDLALAGATDPAIVPVGNLSAAGSPRRLASGVDPFTRGDARRHRHLRSGRWPQRRRPVRDRVRRRDARGRARASSQRRRSRTAARSRAR
ncbi:hypothetical protein ACRAWC_21025 [Leifsonia sp. L25]|uniref:hypothetical protein n=1 Tax=Leifsonia TaxID=110932 RepID=UPI003D675467